MIRIVASLACLLSWNLGIAQDLVITNARVIDGAGQTIDTDWAESLRGGVEKTLDMLAQQLGRREFIVGREFSVADITGFLGVKYAELLAGIKPPDDGSVAEWVSRISEREGARSFHEMLNQIEDFMEALRQANSTD